MVLQRNTAKGHIYVQGSQPAPLAEGLRRTYGSKFEHIVMSSGPGGHNISFGEKKFFQRGGFLGQEAPSMLTLQIEKGTRDGLKEKHSVLLSTKLAASLFGNADPMGKTILIDNRVGVKVTGVYQDMPANDYICSLEDVVKRICCAGAVVLLYRHSHYLVLPE